MIVQCLYPYYSSVSITILSSIFFPFKWFICFLLVSYLLYHILL
nr:MAG TPA: hypothetical protein [Caudoviricetes sp.]